MIPGDVLKWRTGELSITLEGYETTLPASDPLTGPSEERTDGDRRGCHDGINDRDPKLLFELTPPR